VAGILAAVDRLQAAAAEVVLLEGADRRPELAVVGQGEVVQLPLAQLGADRAPLFAPARERAGVRALARGLLDGTFR
jgi:hypothetical protein